jgi:exodeoxyribonuclease III
MPSLYDGAMNKTPMKLATWNVNSLTVRLPQLLTWLAAHQPDAMVLQETKMTDDKFPHADIQAAGYHVHWFGQKTYNGVALLSRAPASDIVRNIPNHTDEQARVIAGTVAGVRVVGAYVPNGQSVESEKYPYKLAWLQAFHAWLAAEIQQHPNLVVMGDFNIAPADADVHDPAKWAGQVLCTDAERAALQGLLGLGLVDTFRLFEQPPKTYSWWDYRMLGFQKNQGLRIDLILASDALRARVQSSTIDRAQRKVERASDHAPVVMVLGD